MRLFKIKKKPDETSRSDLRAAVQGNIEFALDLFQHLGGVEGNLFFSPYSISTALAMTFLGARSDTQDQMAKTLHFALEQDQLHPAFELLASELDEAGAGGHVQFRIANALWPQKGIKFLKTFRALTKKFYGVRLTPVNFADEETARNTINSWVEDKTERKIKDLIAPGVLDAATRLVLVNAIYFKGAWANPFDPNLTNLAAFMPVPKEPIQVQMMKQKNTFRYAENDNIQILGLPYAGDTMSMLVLLPMNADGLAKLKVSLTVDRLDKWIRNMQETEVEVFLPRFELSFPFRLDDTLKSMGMVNAFSGEADFSGMDGSQSQHLGAVLHKAFVEVNEKGTEAAAATAAVMELKAISLPEVVFRADHPFVFLIRENKTGSILFIGRVMNPS